jgi:hypothetical protein
MFDIMGCYLCRWSIAVVVFVDGDDVVVPKPKKKRNKKRLHT